MYKNKEKIVDFAGDNKDYNVYVILCDKMTLLCC